MNLGMPELIIIFVIVMFLFGGKKLPGLGKALGESIRGFKDGLSGQEPPTERQAQVPHENAKLLNGQPENSTDAAKEKERQRQS